MGLQYDKCCSLVILPESIYILIYDQPFWDTVKLPGVKTTDRPVLFSIVYYKAGSMKEMVLPEIFDFRS